MERMKKMKLTKNSDILRNDLYKAYTTRIRNRITRRNQNWLCLIVGQTGHGKSYAAAKLCQDIDPTFMDSIRDEGLKSRVSVGNQDDFLNIVKLAKNKKIKRGSMVLFDEAGVSISCRKWFEQNQIALMNILQSFRILNIGTIITTPNMSFIDNQARKLIHEYLKALKVHYGLKRVILKPFSLSTGKLGDKIITKYHWFKGTQMTRLFVPKPAKDFIKPYEKEKDVLLNFLISEAESQAEIDKAKEEHKKLTDKDIMTDIKNGKARRDAYELQFIYGIGKDRAYRILKNYDKYSPTL